MKQKILCLSTGDTNGAYEALYRISNFCHDDGYFVKLLVKYKNKNSEFVHEYHSGERFLTRAINKLTILCKKVLNRFKSLKLNGKYLFLDEDEQSSLLSGNKILNFINFKPDLIIIGMTNGFINTETVAELYDLTNAKIFFLITDMYPLTGGCHYSWGCEGYTFDCRNCPGIENGNKYWAYENLQIKLKNLSRINAKAISMSGLATQQIKKSKLFGLQGKVHNVNSLIDLKIFNCNSRSFAKTFFEIPNNAFTILIGSQSISDERKGTKFILEALKILSNKKTLNLKKDNICILLAGRDKNSVQKFKELLPFNTKFIEYVTDYRLLALLYQSTDLFLCGSIEDTGPMMVSEALACGTPVVGFDTGVTSNMVVDNYNGYKIPIGNTESFADGIEKIINLNNEEFLTFSQNSHQQVVDFSSKKVCLDIIKYIVENDN